MAQSGQKEKHFFLHTWQRYRVSAQLRHVLADRWVESVAAEDLPCFTFPLGNKRPNELRYFHYSEIAKLLGATGLGRRVKLPKCVCQRIAETYPDKKGARTKVGYKQDRNRD